MHRNWLNKKIATPSEEEDIINELISKKEKLPQIIGYKIIKKKHIELPEYNQPIPEDKDEEKEDKEEENNIN